MRTTSDDRGLLPVLLADGRPCLAFVGVGLLLAGLFALFLALTGEFLPHDERFLGMTAAELCSLHGCRVVHFMTHDRASLGGALIALGLLYLWLAHFPLRAGQAWAWWAFLLTGLLGYGSFLLYSALGYLDTWHTAATGVLLAGFAVGLARSWRTLPAGRGVRFLLRPARWPPWRSPAGVGRACLLATAAGMIGAGLTILAVGVSCVFVPEDLRYLGLSVAELDALNPRLVPLIAHDRAGFGGVVCCCGLAIFFAVWNGPPSRSLWQVLTLAGLAGFGTAVGIHPAVGYNDPVHLAPALAGALAFLVGLGLTYRRCHEGEA